MPHHNVKSLLVHAANGSDVDTTIVNGSVLMRNRKLLTIDEDELIAEACRRAADIVRGL